MARSNVFTGWLGAIGRGLSAAWNSVTGVSLEEAFRRMVGSPSAAGMTVGPDSSLRVAAFYACVRLISGTIKNMPIQVNQWVAQNNRQPAVDHAVYKLMTTRPNSWMTPSVFKQLLTSWALLRGDGCALIVRSLKKPTALIPLFPDRLDIREGDDGLPVYRYTTKRGTVMVIPAADVLHIMPFTLNGINGVTPITYARETLGLNMALSVHAGSMFKNGTHMGGLLKHPKRLDEGAKESLRKSLDAYRGSENAGKNLVLEEGMTYERLAMTAEDAQFIETYKLTRADICMFMGVPPHMIGDTSGTTHLGSSLDGMTQGFVTFTIEDYLTSWEEAINFKLIADDTGAFYAKFNRNALVRGDLTARWSSYKDGLQWGVMSPDEVRALEDMNPRSDGKGGRYYDPPNTAGTPSNPKGK